jgi:hypothetical protein
MAYLGEINREFEQKQLQDKDGSPKTLWDLFMEYMDDKEKTQDRKFVDVAER